jgi:hypothetical protein
VDAIANLCPTARATVLGGVTCDQNSKSIINRILKFLLASHISLGCLATTSPAVQYRREGTAGDLAQGQSGRSGVGAESLYETARKLDGKGHFDIADRDWVLESLCLLEVAIGLALGDGAIPGQLLGSLRPQGAFKMEVTFCVKAVYAPGTMFPN